MHESVSWKQVRKNWLKSWMRNIVLFFVYGLSIQLSRQGCFAQLPELTSIRWIRHYVAICCCGCTQVAIDCVKSAHQYRCTNSLGRICRRVSRPIQVYLPIWKSCAIPAPMSLAVLIKLPRGHSLHNAIPCGVCHIITQDMCSSCHD